jgi:protein SCO1/2
MCSQTLGGIVAGLRPLSLVPGRDFDIVIFSFNPAETAQDAREARDTYTRRYSRRAGATGWHFLTGSQASIDGLAQAIGFKYRWDPDTRMFVHVAAAVVVTPDARIARYFYGVEYAPKDLKLGLIEASNGKIGSAVDQMLLFCYEYDPSTGKYGAVVMNILKLAGVASLILMAIGLAIAWRFDVRRHRAPLPEAHR